MVLKSGVRELSPALAASLSCFSVATSCDSLVWLLSIQVSCFMLGLLVTF